MIADEMAPEAYSRASKLGRPGHRHWFYTRTVSHNAGIIGSCVRVEHADVLGNLAHQDPYLFIRKPVLGGL